MDSDFSVGFKQGQEHGKEIIVDKVKDALEEIEEECARDMTYDKIAKLHCVAVVKKHLGEELVEHE